MTTMTTMDTTPESLPPYEPQANPPAGEAPGSSASTTSPQPQSTSPIVSAPTTLEAKPATETPSVIDAAANASSKDEARQPPQEISQRPSHSTAAIARASRDAVWYLKPITWPPRSDKTVLIIMQSRNGPCSLICLCNVLILRGDIEIRPLNRTSVSYEYLASLVADYLVTKMTGNEMEGLSAALSKLPSMQEGMDINSVWSNHTSFKQLGEGGELKVFELCGISLVHGWLADPDSSEYEALLRAEDYDAAMTAIVAADHLTNGQLVESDTGAIRQNEGPVSTPELTDEQKQVIHDAVLIRQFLDANSSQLTYYGLFHLSSTLSPGLYAFFRNSHLSVLLKTPYPDQPLYTLVTDSTFANEPVVVWESLEDVDGAASNFVDSNFMRSTTAGGDYSGETAETALREAERAIQNLSMNDDLALARQLQAEEEQLAKEVARRREQRRKQENAAGSESRSSVPQPSAGSSARQSNRQNQEPGSHKVEKKPSKEQCILM
ncbi:hypothetical protein FRC03_011504 [Tulasnella sp. 419]|nr:hypothetical protein FRC03_011504 [Tulasnella sp. 419]